MDKHFFISVTPMGEDLFATIFFDITEQKRTQERYQLISENAADVIWMWDLEEGRCAYVSPSVQQLRGFSSEEIMAQPMDQAMPGDTCRMATGEIQRRRAAVESGDEGARIDTSEIEFLRKDGTTVATETVTRLVSDGRGKVRYLVGVSRDITGLKRAEAEKARIEDELRQAQKLESVGRLAAGVAHDFNNLLTVINGYSRLLLGSLKADDPLRDGLEEIHKAGERAAGLTQQLLAFSRKQILQPRVLDLNRVVEEMRPMLARLMGEDVEVCVQLQAEAATICADPHQLEQVLMNLAVNSRDAMPHGGKFSIETGGCGMGREPGPIASGGARGPLRHAGGERHRRGHERRDAPAHLRTVLHHQGSRQRDRTGAVDDPWHRGAERRLHRGRSEPGPGPLSRSICPGWRTRRPKPEAGSRSRDWGQETVLVVEDQAEVRNMRPPR
jgi:PAS domain S-box-containing protein